MSCTPNKVFCRTANQVASESSLLGPLADIEAQLAAAASSHPNIYRESIGKSCLCENVTALGASCVEGGGSDADPATFECEQQNDIWAMQFGPLGDAQSSVPTVYLAATYHAREWGATGTAMFLVDYLRQTVTNPAFDPDLRTALSQAAVVVVPVVNPDGYEHTWEMPGAFQPPERFWRGNRNLARCSASVPHASGKGVDLNRNHTVSWGAMAARTSDSCAGETYRGPSAASEPETRAMESLYRGTAMTMAQDPAAVVAYHTYGNLVLYPDGWSTGSGFGTSCPMVDSNCFNADFLELRRAFGDTERAFDSSLDNFWVDNGNPYYRDHKHSILQTVSGDATTHNMHHPTDAVLAITPELPNDCLEFTVECTPGTIDSRLEDIGLQQVALLTHLLTNASGLVSTTESLAFGPNEIGTLSAGLWTREHGYSGGPSANEARPTFIKGVFRPESTGSLNASINSMTYTYTQARRGTHYDLFSLQLATNGLNPLEIPCRISSQTMVGGNGSDDATICSGGTTINLCDPSRLVATDWELVSKPADATGPEDCYWEPRAVGGTLRFPHRTGWDTLSPQPSHCHFMFSASWSTVGPGQTVVLEREGTTGGWDELWRFRYERPYFTGFGPENNVFSFVYEANAFLPTDTAGFRFRVENGVPTDFRIYDPVLYCRLGGLPR
ncbi:MAG: M14 family zinc carboxypeptidase [Myxococcota bacterium]